MLKGEIIKQQEVSLDNSIKKKKMIIKKSLSVSCEEMPGRWKSSSVPDTEEKILYS